MGWCNKPAQLQFKSILTRKTLMLSITANQRKLKILQNFKRITTWMKLIHVPISRQYSHVVTVV